VTVRVRTKAALSVIRFAIRSPFPMRLRPNHIAIPSEVMRHRAHQSPLHYLRCHKFSLVPSFFSCLSSDRSAEAFVDFLCETARQNLPAAKTLGRAIFAVPEFRMFLSRVGSDMKIKQGRLAEASGSTSAGDFSKEFVRCWIASAALCPAIVANALSRVGDSVGFFKAAFVEPALAHTTVYIGASC
jgi:hypothetical protein